MAPVFCSQLYYRLAYISLSSFQNLCLCKEMSSFVPTGSGALVFISYSILNSIIPDRFVNEENLSAALNLGKVHLQSRVVSAAIGEQGPTEN